MSVATKIIALFEALRPTDMEALAPCERRRFADLCLHWATLAEPSRRQSEPGSTGILDELRTGAWSD